jgi:hypothetical protein
MENVTLKAAIHYFGALRTKACFGYLDQLQAPATAEEITRYIAIITTALNSPNIILTQKVMLENLLIGYISLLSLTVRKPFIETYLSG